MKISNEVWKAVPGYDGFYEVSSAGQVRSVKRSLVCHGTSKLGKQYLRTQVFEERILSPTLKHGYKVVTLCKHSSMKSFCVHVLVARAFIGEKPIGTEVCHGNGDRKDNRAENLRYATRKENIADQKIHGTSNCGERHYASKLSASDVDHIRSSSLSGNALAKMLGVSQATISRVRSGQRWKEASSHAHHQ